MACTQWRDDWVAHLYGELDAADERRVTEHLADCRSCRETLDALAASRRLLQDSAPYVPAAPRVVMIRPRRAGRTVRAFAAGMACALLVFSVGWLAGSGRSPDADPSTPRILDADLVTRAEVEQALRSQQEQFEARLATYEKRTTSPQQLPEAWLTRDQLVDELTRYREEVDYAQARDFRILAGKIGDVEARAATWIDENRDALRLALRYRGIDEH